MRRIWLRLSLYARVLGRLGQRIQAPLGRSFLVARAQALPLPLEPSGRRLLDEREKAAAFLLGQARFASRSWAHPQARDALRIEARHVDAHGLRVAAQDGGNLIRRVTGPAFDDHTGMAHPVGRGVMTLG